MSKFFVAVNVRLGAEHLTTAAYLAQSNGQVECFNTTIVASLQHYFAKYQTYWDQYIQLLTYALKVQVHQSMGKTSFSLVGSREPEGSTTLNPASAIPDDMKDLPEPIHF